MGKSVPKGPPFRKSLVTESLQVQRVPRKSLMLNKNLNLARLPIPPRGLNNQRNTTENTGRPKFCILPLYTPATFPSKSVSNFPRKSPVAS